MLWKTFAMLAICALAACASTQPAERQSRVSECLAGCNAARDPSRTGPFDQNAGQRDQRNSCEQSCQSKK
jgi:hypothetical protein